MANYYMITTTEIDFEWDIENKFSCIGLPSRYKKTLISLEIGDKIVFYVSKQSKFMGIVEVEGDYFYSEEQIWDDPYDLWPCRRKTKPIIYKDSFEDGVYIKDIWDNLDLIKNKSKWGCQVQGSFRKLSDHDYLIIEKSLKKKESL